VKTVPSAHLTHYALGTTTMAHAIYIVREDGEEYGFTEHDVTDTIDGQEYLAEDPGFSVSEIVIASGCDVGSMEITALNAGTYFTPADILHDKWRNARFVVFRYNHRQGPPIVDIDECLGGTFGEVEMRDATLVIELHDLRRYLNHPVGSARSKTCRYRLGSTSMADGGLCMKDISDPPNTVTFTVTHVGANPRLTFRASALAHAADWFGEGYVEFDAGDLIGVKRRVWSYEADGTFELALPTFLPVQVGDTGIAVVGCRKRRTEDCHTKHSNVLNFGGEPDARGVDTLTRSASAG